MTESGRIISGILNYRLQKTWPNQALEPLLAVNIREPSLIRDAVGFIAGAILAAVVSGAIFVAFVPLGDVTDGRNHAPDAFMLTVLVMFVCGAFIGRKGFSCDNVADLLPSIITTYAVVVILALVAGVEILPFVGFASAGVVASIFGSLLLRRLVPLRSPDVQL